MCQSIHVSSIHLRKNDRSTLLTPGDSPIQPLRLQVTHQQGRSPARAPSAWPKCCECHHCCAAEVAAAVESSEDFGIRNGGRHNGEVVRGAMISMINGSHGEYDLNGWHYIIVLNKP